MSDSNQYLIHVQSSIRSIMENFENLTAKESVEKPLFKITLMRHEEPFYKDEGHDLTERGVQGAIMTGKRLREEGRISNDDEMYLLHSPKPRAKGTLDFVAEGAELKDISKQSIGSLRQSDIPNRDAFMSRVAELGHDHENIAKDHYVNLKYENDPDFIEPNSKKKERLYRSFEYLLRWLDAQPQGSPKTPHILAVSHFEIITHLIDDVFGIETTGKYNSPAFGEQVNIEGFSTGDPQSVRLKVTYNQQVKIVQFNRVTRSVEVL